MVNVEADHQRAIAFRVEAHGFDLANLESVQNHRIRWAESIYLFIHSKEAALIEKYTDAFEVVDSYNEQHSADQDDCAYFEFLRNAFQTLRYLGCLLQCVGYGYAFLAIEGNDEGAVKSVLPKHILHLPCFFEVRS